MTGKNAGQGGGSVIVASQILLGLQSAPGRMMQCFLGLQSAPGWLVQCFLGLQSAPGWVVQCFLGLQSAPGWMVQCFLASRVVGPCWSGCGSVGVGVRVLMGLQHDSG